MQRKRLSSFILGLFQINKTDKEKDKEVREPVRKKMIIVIDHRKQPGGK